MHDGDRILCDFRNDDLGPFYDKVHAGLVVYARKHLGEAKAMYAEDCVQNAVFKAWLRRDSFASILAFKSFLYISVRNEILNIHRNDSVRSRYLEQLEDLQYFTASVIDQEAREMLFNAINELPEKERQVLVMSYIDGMKNSEIAEHLNISIATIKRYKANSIRTLREQLELAVLLGAALSLHI